MNPIHLKKKKYIYTKIKPQSWADAIFQLPVEQSACLASGLAGCTSLLHKYCTTNAWWKPPLLSGTTALWRASLSTVWINCTYKLCVFVSERDFRREGGSRWDEEMCVTELTHLFNVFKCLFCKASSEWTHGRFRKWSDGQSVFMQRSILVWQHAAVVRGIRGCEMYSQNIE